MYQTKSYFYNPLFIISHVLFLSALVLWFNPLTHAYFLHVDESVFKLLNGSLVDEPEWQAFWGMLNHRRETKLNLLFAALFNVWAILATHDKTLRYTRLKQTLYFWVCFQIGFMLQEGLFNNLLHVVRDSPSIALKPLISLSQVLDSADTLKERTQHSFPSGHAFSLIYWASFTLLSAPKHVAISGLILAVFLCLPRLFIGAHWLSDEVFSILIALVWLAWTVNNPLYRKLRGDLNQTFRNNFKNISR